MGCGGGRTRVLQVRKMYQLDANNFIMILTHKWPLHVSDIYMSIFRSSYMLFHCRMWCYAIGVEAVVLRIWCVVLCTVCQLVSIYEIKS